MGYGPSFQQSQQEPAVAVVTGASRGIGRAVAERLAADGAHVIVGYRRSAEAAADVVAELKRLGGGGTAVQAELEEPDGVTALFDAAALRFGRVDCFVSCAAASAFKHVIELKQHHLDRAYAVNFRAFVTGAQQAVQLMDRGGRIVALTSYGSTRVFPPTPCWAPTRRRLKPWSGTWRWSLPATGSASTP